MDGWYGQNCQYKHLNSTIFNYSTILTNEQSVKLINLVNLPSNLNWSLIYQASVNGFSANSFHTNCGSTRNTLTIIKTTNSFVFGGFTSSDWSVNNYGSNVKYDPNAFLFSLVNGYNAPAKMNVTQPMQVITVSYSNGPIFGSSRDLYISDSSNVNTQSYSNLGSNFQLPNFLLNLTNATNSSASTTGNKTSSSFLAGSNSFMTLEIEVYSTDRNLY